MKGQLIAGKLWPPQSSYWIDVRERGAVGDGVADDWEIIQECIDAVDGSRVAGVYFPPGYYRCTRTLLLHDCVRLSGEPLLSTINTEADIGIAFWSKEEDSLRCGTKLPPFNKCRPRDSGETPIWQTKDPPVTRNNWMCRINRLYGIRVESPKNTCRFAVHTMGLHCTQTDIDECYFIGRIAGFVSTGDMMGCAIRNSMFHPGLWFINKNPQSVFNTSVIERVQVGAIHNQGDDYSLKFIGASQMLSVRNVTMQGRKKGILWQTTGNGVASEIDGIYFCDGCDIDGVNPIGANAENHRYGRVLDVQNAGMGLIVRNVMSFPSATIHVKRSAGPVWLTNVATCKIDTINPSVRIDSGPEIILKPGDMTKMRDGQVSSEGETAKLVKKMNEIADEKRKEDMRKNIERQKREEDKVKREIAKRRASPKKEDET